MDTTLDLRPTAAEMSRAMDQRPDLELTAKVEPVEDTKRWTGADTAWEAAFAASMLADWIQTQRIAQLGRETNPILGRSPSPLGSAAYFAGLTAAHALAAYALPKPWRRILQVGGLAVEAPVIAHNLSRGYGFKL